MKSRSMAVSLVLICAALVISTYGTVAYGAEDLRGAEGSIRFNAITGADAEAAAIGENQLRLNVIPNTVPTQKIFEFQNSGPSSASVTGIFFDDERLIDGEASDGVLWFLVVPTITPDLAFTVPVVTPELEGASLVVPPFETTDQMDLIARSIEGGVGPGETLRVTTVLLPGVTNAQVIQALETGRLRVGLQVEGFHNGETAEFVSISAVSPVVIPAPATILLGSIGVGVVGLLRRRKML